FSTVGIIQGLGWAAAVYGIVKMGGSLLGLEPGTTNAAATALSAGLFAGKTAFALFGKGGYFASTTGGFVMGPLTATIIGAAIAVAIFVLMYKKTSTKIVTFQCEPWDAATGGSNCEKCNQQGGLPCSEYQCRSLGQSCSLLNPGTEDEKCVWVNKNDVEFPVITPLTDALLDDYKYKPDNTVSPPDRGVIVFNQKSTVGCAKAFTPVSFGISTNEPAKCKLDVLRKDNFDDMELFFGGSSSFKYNHTQALSLPGPDALEVENLTLQNDGQYELYVRCQDANGNSNTATFQFSYCVEKGPDTTPPIIVSTNLLNGMPIAFNQSSMYFEAYVNEPAECKWSHVDRDYDAMEETMSCSTSVFEMNAQMLYKCSTTLTGLKNSIENKFYFRCKDKPLATEDRNVNTESYAFSLIGTQPLVINNVGPNNETIKDSSDIVKVTLEADTSAGYKEGEATCYYSDSENEDSFVMFYNTQSYTHSQELYLPEGDYEYFIKCLDLGGNSDTKKINFEVESDTSAPLVARVYHEDGYLKLTTTEEAECVYDSTNCNYLFDDGTGMTSKGADHFTSWNTNINFYIKCKDGYGNEPLPNQCSIIARPFEIYE
ncbi:MAG: hypothetical protein ABIA78_03800, partial [archaeon]